MRPIVDKTQVAQHPWVTDVQAELARLDKQRAKDMELYSDFGPETGGAGGAKGGVGA